MSRQCFARLAGSRQKVFVKLDLSNAFNTTTSTQLHPFPTQHPVLNSIPLQERTLRGCIKIPTRPLPARPPPARPPCVRGQQGTKYSTASVSYSAPSTQQQPLPAQHLVLNSIPLQERTLRRCIKTPTRLPPARPPAARPPAVRPRSTGHQVLNSIHLQHDAEYSAASAQKNPCRGGSGGKTP